MSSKIGFGVFIVFVYVMIYFFIGPFPNYNYVQKKEESSVCLQVKNNITRPVYWYEEEGVEAVEVKVYPFLLKLLNLDTEITNQDLRDIELMEAAVKPLKEHLVCKKQL